MIQIRPANQRGHANHGWLDTYHSFSFASYYDPSHMGFRTLRVINDDTVAPAQGFGTHGHRDMEIISYVLEGALEHKDSIGTGSVLRPGDVQRMSAGTGVTHSEFNHSSTEALRFLQIWILPGTKGLDPEYEEKTFARQEKLNQLRLIASPNGRDGSLSIHQDVSVYSSVLEPEKVLSHTFATKRHGWVQIARGRVELDGQELGCDDGVAISETGEIKISGVDEAELLLFDLA